MARAGLGLLAVLLLSSVADTAFADPPPRRARAEAGKKSRGKARKERKEKKRSPRPDADERRETVAAPKQEGSAGAGLSAAQKAAQDAAQGANAQIIKEGDTSVKVMSFSGLDIEGRLKSPQLLYFVSRVHAEFDRPKLPHRSFMPELKRSGEQEPLR